MNDIQCLSHTKWDCKYHFVWIPKYRRKTLYGELRKNLGDVFHGLARQKKSKVLEGHLQSCEEGCTLPEEDADTSDIKVNITILGV